MPHVIQLPRFVFPEVKGAVEKQAEGMVEVVRKARVPLLKHHHIAGIKAPLRTQPVLNPHRQPVLIEGVVDYPFAEVEVNLVGE